MAIGSALVVGAVAGTPAPVLSQDEGTLPAPGVFACHRNDGERMLRVVAEGEKCGEHETFVRLSPGEQGPPGPPGDGNSAFARRWFRDDDGDGHGDWYRFIDSPAAPPGFVDAANDCDDTDRSTYEGRPGDYPGRDANCDERLSAGAGEARQDPCPRRKGRGPVDCDGDGHSSEDTGGDDCQDLNGLIYPGAYERRDDFLDNDCKPTTPDSGYMRSYVVAATAVYSHFEPAPGGKGRQPDRFVALDAPDIP
jgi:hypothetical protein